MAEINNDEVQTTANVDELLNRAAGELITGDSDDPPLSKEGVLDMLRDLHLYHSRSLWPSTR
jgi:hypothetical protein